MYYFYNMETLDLEIENYELQDIVNLFHINVPFQEEDLKKAKKLVLKTHPDKSGLKPEIFLFYSKAYKKLYSIWEFTNKHRLLQTDNKYVIDDFDEKNHKGQLSFSKDKEKALDHFLSNPSFKDTKKFNDWFNKEFEKTNIISEDQSNGYGNWFQSDEDLEECKEFHGEEFELKKKQIRDIIPHNDITEMNANGSIGTQIISSDKSSYSSDVFSNLYYEDLKKAYTETVIPVTEEDYQNVRKFKNVNEYQEYRSSQNTVPLSESQANEYLNNRANLQSKETIFRAYKLVKETEMLGKQQDKFWSNLKKITNK